MGCDVFSWLCILGIMNEYDHASYASEMLDVWWEYGTKPYTITTLLEMLTWDFDELKPTTGQWNWNAVTLTTFFGDEKRNPDLVWSKWTKWQTLLYRLDLETWKQL